MATIKLKNALIKDINIALIVRGGELLPLELPNGDLILEVSDENAKYWNSISESLQIALINQIKKERKPFVELLENMRYNS